MKRRNFLAMIPFIAAVCCKPRSKGTFEPYVPEEPEDSYTKTMLKFFDEHFPTEEERLDKQIAYYKMLNNKWNT